MKNYQKPNGQFNIIPPPAQPPVPQQQPNGQIGQYLGILEALRSFKAPLTSVPTTTPKTLLDQIQFYNDGTNKRMYFYVSGAWHYTSLT